MFVILSGTVAITQHDGLGHIAPIAEQGPGQFLAEIGQLSNRPALVDAAAEDDVETLLISPEGVRSLLIAEAELGERITRALILRRVILIRKRRRRACPDWSGELMGRRPAAGLSPPQCLSASSARSQGP